MTRKEVIFLLAMCLLASIAATADAKAEPSPAPVFERVSNTPNVVLIVTDDQPFGTMDAMPVTAAQIRDKGVNLTNGLIPTSLCCPSRSSLLTGNYAHTTGVYTNEGSKGIGGWPAFHNGGAENTTLATKLNNAGYNTGLFGKYLNGYSDNRPASFVPPGWDSFVSFHSDDGGSAAYYNYTLEGTLPDEHHGTDPADYSTDVIATKATDFILNTPADQPLFLYFAPYGAHSPTIPAPRDEGTWPLEPASAIPALNEANVSDKPAWVQDNPLVDEISVRQRLTDQHETLMSVDDAVAEISLALGDRANNTLFVFMSDNGYMLGGHRMEGKDVPYRQSTEVPMFIRWDGHIAPNTSSSRPTTNVDLTATIAEATGISMTTEGKSFLSTNRVGTVLEQTTLNDHPAYCGYRNKNYLYVHYTGDSEELYDYTVDPDELRNKADNANYATILADLKAKTINQCVPTPPGFSWN